MGTVKNVWLVLNLSKKYLLHFFLSPILSLKIQLILMTALLDNGDFYSVIMQ